MKHLFNILLSIAIIICITACNNQSKCIIKGTLLDDTRNGKWIYLVPFDKQEIEKYGVDSTQIKNRKFVFEVEHEFLATIRLGFQYRFGVQDLLVVTEQGQINVTIGVESKGWGTPQNDSLQKWKESTENFNLKYRELYMSIKTAQKTENKAEEDSLKTIANMLIHRYKEQTNQMAKKLNDGVLKEFLKERIR